MIFYTHVDNIADCIHGNIVHSNVEKIFILELHIVMKMKLKMLQLIQLENDNSRGSTRVAGVVLGSTRVAWYLDDWYEGDRTDAKRISRDVIHDGRDAIWSLM
jgi:hypothetical protein